MGVNVPVYKAAAFTVSSMYAGLGGVFLALAFGRIVPESFGFLVSIDFLVMIVIGGLGSIGGAIAGAVLDQRAAADPQPLQRRAAAGRRAGRQRPAGDAGARASSTAPPSSPS